MRGADLHDEEWARYNASMPTDDVEVTAYRAERDAYVRGINTSDAVVSKQCILEVQGRNGVIPVRIYYPANFDEQPLPIVFYLHGGGWTVGGGDALEGTYKTYCAATRCIVVTPDYRLAPEHKFPAAIEDCWDVAQWLASSAQSIGGDADRIVIAGESAGGNLAAAVSALARDHKTASYLAQILVYPVLDLAGDTPSFLNAQDTVTRDKLRWYMNSYLKSDANIEDPLASPLRAKSFEGLPRTVMITGGDEPSIDEIEQYVDKLREAGVEIEYHRLEGWPHGFAFWPETEAYGTMMNIVTGAVRAAMGER